MLNRYPKYDLSNDTEYLLLCDELEPVLYRENEEEKEIIETIFDPTKWNFI